MPTQDGMQIVDLTEMDAKIVGTPEYILPFLIEIREGWIKNRLATRGTASISAMLNVIILNTELMIENQSQVV